jgi:hypothetical protein
MILVNAHFEGHPEGTCQCGSPGTVSMVIRTGADELVVDGKCIACLVNNQHGGWLEPPKLPSGGPPTKRMKRTSRLQEKRVSDGVGARTSLASGAMASDKSDARIRGVLRIENKFTYGRAFSLTREVLNKIRSECTGAETPMLQIEFKDKTTNRTQDAWACIPHKIWEKMFNELAQHR